MESDAEHRRRYRESLNRQVWLGFKAGCLSRGHDLPPCPHASESPLQAVWQAAVDVARNPETIEQRVEIFPSSQTTLVPDQTSLIEKLNAIMDELGLISGKVADMEYAIKMFPVVTAAPAKVAKKKPKRK